MRLGLACALLVILTACQSSDAGECARPEQANKGYRNVADDVERVVRQRLFDSGYTVLAKGGGGELDAGTRDVRARLRRAHVDPAKTALSTFRSNPEYDITQVAGTREGPLATQVAAVTGRVQQTVDTAARELPAKNMTAWRDDLGRRTNDATAAAFFADPTYRAGFAVDHPGWDGTIGTMRRDPANANLVNTISGDVVTAVEKALTAACAKDD